MAKFFYFKFFIYNILIFMKIIKMKRDSILEYLKNGSSKNCNNFNFIEYDCDAKLLSHLSTELDELLIHLTNSWALEKEKLNSLSIDFS